MCQLDWWKHKHAQLLLAKRSEVWLFNYCSAITSSIPTGIFRYFIIAFQGTKYVSGHKRVRAQTYTFLPIHVCYHTIITCQGTNVSGHKHVGTNVSGHKHVWAQTCLDTNMCGHKRVWVQTCLGSSVWAQTHVQTCLDTNICVQTCLGSSMYGHKRVVSERKASAQATKYFFIWQSFVC